MAVKQPVRNQRVTTPAILVLGQPTLRCTKSLVASLHKGEASERETRPCPLKCSHTLLDVLLSQRNNVRLLESHPVVIRKLLAEKGPRPGDDAGFVR